VVNDHFPGESGLVVLPRFFTSTKEVMFSSLSVFLLATLHKNFQMDLHEIFSEGWQWASQQMRTFWWQSGSLSGYRNCFPNLSLMGDTESGINRLRCATLQCTARTSRHCHSNYDVITSPSHNRQPRQTCLGRGMHCPSASSLSSFSYFKREPLAINGSVLLQATCLS